MLFKDQLKLKNFLENISIIPPDNQIKELLDAIEGHNRIDTVRILEELRENCRLEMECTRGRFQEILLKKYERCHCKWFDNENK